MEKGPTLRDAERTRNAATGSESSRSAHGAGQALRTRLPIGRRRERQPAMHIVDLLRKMVVFGASDLHVKAGSCPGYRIDGRVLPDSEDGELDPETTSKLAS